MYNKKNKEIPFDEGGYYKISRYVQEGDKRWWKTKKMTQDEILSHLHDSQADIKTMLVMPDFPYLF